MSMDGKVVVVTGGAMGIGRAISEKFSDLGARLVIADRDGAQDAAKALSRSNHPALGVTCDVSSPEDTQAMAEAARGEFGRIDVLVNNAGIYSSLQPKPFEELEVEEWRGLLDVNVIGQFLACKAVVPVMKSQGEGRIINISSGTPFKGVPFMLHYVASKGAINAMTKALAKELGGFGVNVNGVAPGFTLSDGVWANPVQLEKLKEISLQARVIARDQLPGDVVGAVAFLASDEASFMTGQTLVVDGGAYFH